MVLCTLQPTRWQPSTFCERDDTAPRLGLNAVVGLLHLKQIQRTPFQWLKVTGCHFKEVEV